MEEKRELPHRTGPTFTLKNIYSKGDFVRFITYSLEAKINHHNIKMAVTATLKPSSDIQSTICSICAQVVVLQCGSRWLRAVTSHRLISQEALMLTDRVYVFASKL